MKIKTNIIKKRKILIVVIAILVAATIVYTVYAAVLKHNSTDSSNPTDTSSSSSSNKKVDSSPATPQQVQAGNDTKLNTVNNSAQSGTGSSTPLSVSITAANQNGATVSVRSLIDGIVSQSGTCTITVTNGSKTYSNTASVQALANSSTCQGFDIQTSQLGTGSWNIQLSVSIGTQTGSVAKSLAVQ